MDNASANVSSSTTVDLYRAIPVSILLAVIDLIVIFGNILVILAVLTTRTLRQITCNYYIVSLAVSDLLLGICVLPFSSVYEILNYWIFPSFFCVIWLTADVLSCTASILNLLCISVDRYLAISRPLHYHNYSSTKFVLIMIGAAWVLAIFVSVAPVFGFESGAGDGAGRTDECKVAASGLFWALYSSVGSFFLPLFIMLFLYYRIYLVAAKHSKFMREERERFASYALPRDEVPAPTTAVAADTGRNMSIADSESIAAKPDHPRISRVSKVTIQSAETPQGDYQILPKDSVQLQPGTMKRSTLMKRLRRMSKDQKAAKTLFIVMACFIGCWLPFFTVYLIDGVCKQWCAIPSWIFKVNFWLGYCNSMLNPVIYAASSHEFRTAFRRILHCALNPINTDQFAEMDHHRAQNKMASSSTGNALSTGRPTGNGLSKTANRLRHCVASHFIRKRTNNSHEPAKSDRFPANTNVAGENYPPVVQQDTRLSPITSPGQQVRKIANLTLEKQPLEISSDANATLSTADHRLGSNQVNSPVKYPYSNTCASGTYASPEVVPVVVNTNTRAQVLLTPTSPSGSLTPVLTPDSASAAAGSPGLPDRENWITTKNKAKRVVAILVNKFPHYNSPEKSPITNGVIQRVVEVADAGISTNEPEVTDIGVQTSVSFVDLGLI
ncbi:probable G-protein coupled receptor No18 [Paramacrobiotus metropolitanus]|uniref:probable G-protein coupled receptor No18 n=1 Tax=Paramacrobiotus metropolitanus TaxID=2943436 RepID=UPI002446571C|nr:probable G-protein coupled receptor No18 [Paramacrobiotus metropolitanus]